MLALLTAILIWGASFIATKLAVARIPPVGFALLRFLLATLCLACAQLLTRTPFSIPRGLRGRVLLAGLLGTTATYVLENIALRYTSAGNAALILALSPLMTVLGAVAFLGEAMSVRLGVGALLAFGGTVALAGASVQQTGVGDALMLANALVGTLYGLISKTLADRLPALTTMTATFAVGTLGLLPCAALEGLVGHPHWELTPLVLVSLGYLGILSSALAYWLWMFALGRMAASSVGVFLYLMPLCTLGFSAWLLGEALTPVRLLEAAAILVGVFLSSSVRGGSARILSQPAAGTGS